MRHLFSIALCLFAASTLAAEPAEKSYELAHFEAVKALIEKNNLDWKLDDMRFGDSADGKGYVFCFNDSIVGK